MLSVSRMSEISRQENHGKRVMTRQEVQQSGEVQQQTLRRARRIVTNMGSEAAEKAFGSDSLFSRSSSDLNIKNGQHTDVEIMVKLEMCNLFKKF